jgi:CHASE2 domain-containing sensor protein
MMAETKKRPTRKTLIVWAIPLVLGVIGLIAVLLAGLLVWLGVMLVVAGALGTLVLVSNFFQMGPKNPG